MTEDKIELKYTDIDTICERHYGIEDEVMTDHLDKFKATEENLIKSLKYIQTCTQEIPLKLNCNYKTHVIIAKGNYRNGQYYIRNLRFEGLNKKDFKYMDYEVGGQRFDRFFNCMYDVYVKELSHTFDNSLLNDNTVIIPILILPLLEWHDIRVTIECNVKSKIVLKYDMYKTENKEYNTTDSKIELLINQVQQHTCWIVDPEPEPETEPYSARLNYFHPINILCIRFKKDTNKKIHLCFNGDMRLLLEHSYIVKDIINEDYDIYVYKFGTLYTVVDKVFSTVCDDIAGIVKSYLTSKKYINFSQIDNVRIMDENCYPITNYTDSFCFNIQMVRIMLGMAGLQFSQ